MDKSKIFLMAMIGFMLGIFFGSLFVDNEFLRLIFLLIVALGLALHVISGFRVFCLIVLMVLLGVLRFFVSFDHYVEEGEVEFVACVRDEVDVRVDKVKYVFGEILVNADRYPVYDFGYCLEVSGYVERPEQIEDFAYDKYLARYGVYGVMNRAVVRKVGEEFSVWKYFFRLKGWFEGRLSEVFAEPHGSFMAGLILGSRKGIPEDLIVDFNATGLTHIVAISGYNITLVILIVSGMFGFLTRRWKVVVSGFFVLLFVLFVGASAAVVRAGVMGVIGLMALYLGRDYVVEIALVAAAFVMSVWNPKILVYDVGFQLSFLATAGLIFVAPKLERFVQWVPDVFAVRESFLMTLSAQVLALPVILVNFERLSLISPIANIFVLPFIPLAMLLGFFSVFFGRIVGFFGYLVLETVVLLVEFFAKFKWASVEVGWFGFWMAFGYYLLVGWWLSSGEGD